MLLFGLKDFGLSHLGLEIRWRQGRLPLSIGDDDCFNYYPSIK